MTSNLILAAVFGSLLLPLISGLLGVFLRRRLAVMDVVLRFTFVLLLALPFLAALTPRVFHVQKMSVPQLGDSMNSPSEIATRSKVFEPTRAIERNAEPPLVALQQENVAPIESGPDRAATVAPLKTPTENDSGFSFLLVISVCWGIGAILCLLILSENYRVCSKIRKTAEPVHAPGWNSLFIELKNRFDVRQDVCLCRSADIIVPQVVGIFRTSLLLPDELLDSSPNPGILIHELAHIKRHDVSWQILSACVSAVYWFHPLIWLHAAAIRRIREEICDAYVLHEGVRASDYATTLLDMASRIQRGHALPSVNSVAVAMPQSKSHLERRILFLFDTKTNRIMVSPLARPAIFASLLGAAILCVMLCPVLGKDPETQAENDPRQFELFGWNVRWNPSSKAKTISPPQQNVVRNFEYYFPKEQLYLENFDDWHAQCGIAELQHLSFVKLNERRNDILGKTAPNEMLLKIAHAQIMNGNLYDAAETLDLIAPVLQRGESTDSNMAQRHDVRRGDELRSEYYLKDRSLRYLARLQAKRQVDEAVKSALKIFSVPERNDALLELMRSECQKALESRSEQEARKHLEKAVEIHGKIVDPSRDHGFGILAVAYGKTGNRSQAMKAVERIVDPDVRELAFSWSVSSRGFGDSAAMDFSLLKLRWRECDRMNADDDEKYRIRTEIRKAVQRLPASSEKFSYLCEIGSVFAYRDHEAMRELLLSIITDISKSDTEASLVIDGAIKILDSNRRYKNRSASSWQGDVSLTDSGFLGLNTEEIKAVGRLIVDRGKTRYAAFSRSFSAEPSNGNDTLQREAGTILKTVLPYYDLPEVAEMIFGLDPRQEVLESLYDNVYRCFRNPRSKGFEDEFFRRAGTVTKKFYLAAILPAFLDAPDFPWKNYLNEIEKTPGAEKCLRDRIEYGLHGRFAPHTPKNIFEERFLALEKLLGVSVVDHRD